MRGDASAGLSMSGISHAFGEHRVLNDVSVDVAPGELVCLLGPSGCGKTTLLRIAAGLEPLQQGRIAVDGIPIAEGGKPGALPPERRGIGLMFQDYALFPHRNVRDNIAFGIDKSKGGRRSAWIDDALAAMGLTRFADAYPHTLSGGQQQRVALIRALAPGPNILLLDEPFSGLDVTRRAQIRTDTLEFVKKTGVATLMVTHDPEEAMFMADRIFVMNEGVVVQDGSPVDLYFQPASAFVAELFGPVSRFTGTVRHDEIETPLGTFSAGELAGGSAAEVMIRPEAFRLAVEGSRPQPMPGDPENLVIAPAPLEVVTARPLGRSSFVQLKLNDGRTIDTRVPGTFLPGAGSKVLVGVNPRLAHVFTVPSAR
ncbi:MAG: ABC transporter ATP-binding protein [Rhodospirillales bacterium]|nr:ABC transporter ATP-binding protein [Rhodospirillales bacterium]MBO6787381.1 ABC transporter ATP-binding protein [Rhodospirillales bacterium]